MKSPIRNSSNTSRNLKLVLTSVLIFAVAACSPGFSPKFASQQRMLLPEVPDQPLSPTVDDPTPDQDPIYNIYRLVSAKFGASANKKEISARIEVQSTQGKEVVDLLGSIREDGSATLIDIQPLEGGKSRLVAEAYCQDGAACKQIILNVVFKVGSHTLRKQFVSDAFIESVGGKKRSPKPATPSQGSAPATTPPVDATGDNSQGASGGNPPNDSQTDSETEQLPNPAAPHGQTTPADDVSTANSVRKHVPADKIIHAKPVSPAVAAPNSTTPPVNGAHSSPTAGANQPAATVPQTPATGAPSGPVAGPTSVSPTAGGPTNTPNLGPALSGADDDGEMTDLDNAGEYVGVQPPESALDKLWVRPEVPAPPPQLPAAGPKTPPASAPATGAKPSAPAPEAGAPAAQPAAQPTTTAPAPAAGSTEPETPAYAPIEGRHAPIEQSPQPGADNSVVTTPPAAAQTGSGSGSGATSGSGSGATSGATGKTAPAPSRPAPTGAQPTAPAPAPKAEAAKPPPPAVAKAQEIPQDAGKSELEQRMSPMLDLRNGGKAIGAYDSGRLVTASELTGQNVYRVLYPARQRQYGTGMMISLIKNATSLMPASFPDQTISVLIGDIAKQTGGNVPHASHQNGLDIDIPYVGETGFHKISDGNRVEADFDYSKTWQFLRLVHSQKLMLSGKEQSALSMVFVDRSIKIGFCRWAKANDLLKNPEDADILRRLYPWVGHRDHFHMRLKCSPHYPACQNRNDPAPGTGC